jgi:chemotaxis protein methyltransferase CheR
MTYFSSFRTVNAPGVTLYQKLDESTPSDGAEALTPSSFRLPPLRETDVSVTDRLPGEGVVSTLADVRRHADLGAWESAVRHCEQLLKQDNLNSTVHFYHALVLGQMRRQDEAEKSLRRALYLNRQFVLAHYYLGLSLQSRGEWRNAARSFENTLDLLGSRDDTDIFADADGITVAELKKLAMAHLEILLERG